MQIHFFNLRLLIFIFNISLLLTSCGKEAGCGAVYPEPVENPVCLTAKVQTKNVQVQYIMGISTDNKEDIVPSVSSTDGEIIRNNWITITYGYGLPHDVVQVRVTENTSNQPRSYKVLTLHKWLETPLIITQNGKVD